MKLQTYNCGPKEDPTAVAEELIRQGFEIDHIEGDTITYFEAAKEPVVIDGMKLSAAAHLVTARGLNTDDFSQTPTIDADRSAAWNRKAKTVKPGSFAARRMAAEE